VLVVTTAAVVPIVVVVVAMTSPAAIVVVPVVVGLDWWRSPEQQTGQHGRAGTFAESQPRGRSTHRVSPSRRWTPHLLILRQET
jgi:hypothetical protein